MAPFKVQTEPCVIETASVVPAAEKKHTWPIVAVIILIAGVIAVAIKKKNVQKSS